MEGLRLVFELRRDAEAAVAPGDSASHSSSASGTQSANGDAPRGRGDLKALAPRETPSTRPPKKET